jgi:hypothetical protein
LNNNMPNYINTGNPMAEAAEFGGAAGNSLAQAMYGVPMQRAQMQMQLQQMQNQQQQQQAMMGYRQQQASNTLNWHNQEDQWHQQQVTENQRRDDFTRDYQQNRLQSEDQWHQQQAQNAQVMQALAMLREQREGGRPVPLGNGNVWFPQQGGGQQSGLVPPANPTNSLVQGPAAPQGMGQPRQMSGPQSGQNGLPQGVVQMPGQPGKNTGIETGGQTDANTMRAFNLAMPYLGNTNSLSQLMSNGGEPLWNALTNRAMGRMPQAQQGTNSAVPWDAWLQQNP